jgi:hypothetical protein
MGAVRFVQKSDDAHVCADKPFDPPFHSVHL